MCWKKRNEKTARSFLVFFFVVEFDEGEEKENFNTCFSPLPRVWIITMLDS